MNLRILYYQEKYEISFLGSFTLGLTFLSISQALEAPTNVSCFMVLAPSKLLLLICSLLKASDRLIQSS